MPKSDKHAAAQQAVDILHEISTILVRQSKPNTREVNAACSEANSCQTLQNCHLDRKTVSICISMIEKGVNPEALAVSRRTKFPNC